MKSSAIVEKLEEDGWTLRNIRGSHHQYVHPEKLGKVTVKHPAKDIPIGTLRNIYRQAGWSWENR
ncbi:MAG: type II toxin-antitoxin system HicA family toxin [Gammaproteobacteria bacterium]|nr:type II toxin-antitoxin system HicA family toxin [Gammaproteobacteria bacterium]